MRKDVLIADLVRDEGLRLAPYKDSVGKLTIGIGRNLEDRGISWAEAQFLLDNDIAIATADLDRNAPWWRNLSEGRQRALVNMAFNLGVPGLMRFEKMLSALERGEYDDAAREALDSRWARQVGARAQRIARLIRKG